MVGLGIRHVITAAKPIHGASAQKTIVVDGEVNHFGDTRDPQERDTAARCARNDKSRHSFREQSTGMTLLVARLSTR